MMRRNIERSCYIWLRRRWNWAKVKVGVGVSDGCQAQKINANGKHGNAKSYMQAVKKEVIKSSNEKVKEVESYQATNVESQVAIPMELDDELVGVFPWKVRS